MWDEEDDDDLDDDDLTTGKFTVNKDGFRRREEPLESKLWWRMAHFLCFFTGGTTFILGSELLYNPGYPNGAILSALLYTIGSFGFLFVDVLEFLAFTHDNWLRSNVVVSMCGSLLYVIGSIGFFPAVYAAR